MNWDAIGAAGELLGAAAVLVTLVYLATQVKRSNELSRFNATKEIVNQFNDLNRLVTSDSTLRKVLMKSDELTPDEIEQIYNFGMMFCNVWVSAQIAYDNDQLDSETYKACAKDVSIELSRWPNFRPALKKWLSNYPEHKSLNIMQPILDDTDSIQVA